MLALERPWIGMTALCNQLRNFGRFLRPASITMLAVVALAGCSARKDRSSFFPNGQVKEKWQERVVGAAMFVRDGPYEAFYPDGAKKVKGEYNRGDSLGLWEEWYMNGWKRSEKTFGEHLKLKGRSVLWMPSGDTLEIHTYNDSGELDGRYVEFWHDSGELREEGKYSNGCRQGKWERWYRNGRLEYEREYDHGRFVGTWTEFAFDGQVASRCEYLKDLPVELARDWQGALVEGVPTGRSVGYQRQGRTVDTVPVEEREYGELRRSGLDWIVPFRWYSPRFGVILKPRVDTLYVLKHGESNVQR